MTNKLSLRSLLFLFTVICWVSGSYSLGAGGNATQQYNNETMLHSTNGPPQTTGIREELSAAASTPSQNTTEKAHSRSAQGNGTSESVSNIEGTETNNTKHQSAGNNSIAGTESPPQTAFPEKNSSLDLSTPSSPPTFSASVGGNGTKSAPVLQTTHHMVINTTTSRTTIEPAVSTTREIKTTPTSIPTSSTQETKSTTKLCPTAETKREGLVSQCLIAIASLAALATIFIMTTIILATKLAGNRYRQRGSLLNDTEMVCISTLMSDSDHPMPTPRHPKSNGALIPITEDEDGDDLTLNSFLHDTEAVA